MIAAFAAEERKTMAHRHLILAYVITILGQLGYAGWVGLKDRQTRKLEREFPPYPSITK
jgi:hypothetical protein